MRNRTEVLLLADLTPYRRAKPTGAGRGKRGVFVNNVETATLSHKGNNHR